MAAFGSRIGRSVGRKEQVRPAVFEIEEREDAVMDAFAAVVRPLHGGERPHFSGAVDQVAGEGGAFVRRTPS